MPLQSQVYARTSAFQRHMADQPAAPSLPYDASDSNPLIRALANLLYAAQVTEYQFRQEADVIRAFHLAMPDLVLHLHADGTLLDVHHSSEFNLFHDTAQVLQRNLDELLPLEPAQTIRAAMDITLREKRPITCDWTLMVDAEIKHFEVRVIYLHPQQVLAIVRVGFRR